MTAPDERGVPAEVFVQAIIAFTSKPDVWHTMTPRRWARLGRLVTVAVGDRDQVLDIIRERHPGWADQTDAAADEAHRLAGMSPPGIHTRYLDPDFAAMCALRGQALRVITGVRGGAMRPCPHVDITRPRPLYASAWGHRVQCRRCLITDPHPEDPTRAESRICDMCGEKQRSPVILATPTVGILTVGMGVCDACVARMAAVAGLDDHGRG